MPLWWPTIYVNADLQTLAEETGGIVADSLEIGKDLVKIVMQKQLLLLVLNLWVKLPKFFPLKREF